MTRYDKLKQEISEMSLDDFMKHFISGKGIRDYICGDIKVPHAHCMKHQEHNCTECIKAYLEGEGTE